MTLKQALREAFKIAAYAKETSNWNRRREAVRFIQEYFPLRHANILIPVKR